MGNLRRKIENIDIDGKSYIMAFDMTSIDLFQELTGKGILKSISELNKLEDKVVLGFLASTIRHEDTPDIPLGKDLYNGEYDLLALMIMMIPTLVKVINQGFPQSKENVKKKSLEEKKK